MPETLICYDIANPRRLGRVHRYLKRHACAVQYSVFLFTGTRQQLDRCLAELEKLMEPKEDDIRAYPLPQRGYRLSLGRSTLPEGIHWAGLAPAWQHAGETAQADHDGCTPASGVPKMPDDGAAPAIAIV